MGFTDCSPDDLDPLVGGVARHAEGRLLPVGVRREMEWRFQSGLKAVRVHTGPAAAAVADRLGARAVTLGPHVLFAAGEYAPHTPAGRWLLAHELAHVIQQQRGHTHSRPIAVGPADDRYEWEADRAADRACAGRRVRQLSPDSSGLARRVIRPDVSSVMIHTFPGEGVRIVAPDPLDFRYAAFLCGTLNAARQITRPCLKANASVVVNGDAGDFLLGWQFGFIQVEWIETNWGVYRGRQNNHGGAFVQRGRPPARPMQACRDTSDNTGSQLFYSWHSVNTWATGPLPQVVVVTGWNDTPSEYYPLQVTNRMTGQLNFLHEVQLEFHFLTVFSAISPSRTIQHLAHFFWNLHWQAKFQPTSFVDRNAPLNAIDLGAAMTTWGIMPEQGQNTFNVGRTYQGAPTAKNARERAMVALLDPATITWQSCNSIAQLAAAVPHQESATWL